MNAVKVYIVDDHEMFRDGVKTLLEKVPNIEIIGEAANGHQCLEEMPAETDIVLMDISMPGMNGIEATQKLMAKNPGLKIIALSMFGDEEYYYKMVHSGVKGFVLKESGSKELEQAINDVSKGQNYFSQELLRNIIVSLSDNKPVPEKEQAVSFSERELEIIHQICKGFSNKEIAEELHISLRTVENHKSRLLQKTDVKNTIGLVIYAIKNDIVNIG